MISDLYKMLVLFLAIAFVVLYGGGFGGTSNPFAMEAQKENSDKPAEEQKSDKSSEDQKTSKPSTPIASSNPLSGKPEAIEEGHKLFTKFCVQCHGPKADGVNRFGKYAADLRKFWRGYNEFVTLVKNGRPEKQMPPWKEYLNNDQISQIGAYLETLAIEGANWK